MRSSSVRTGAAGTGGREHRAPALFAIRWHFASPARRPCPQPPPRLAPDDGLDHVDVGVRFVEARDVVDVLAIRVQIRRADLADDHLQRLDGLLPAQDATLAPIAGGKRRRSRRSGPGRGGPTGALGRFSCRLNGAGDQAGHLLGGGRRDRLVCYLLAAAQHRDAIGDREDVGHPVADQDDRMSGGA